MTQFRIINRLVFIGLFWSVLVGEGWAQSDTTITRTAVTRDDSAKVILLQDTLTRPLGVPVTVFGREVFKIFSPLGTLSPEERAERIGKAIEQLAEEGVNADSITIVDSKSLTIVRVENRNVLTVTDGDALAQETTRQTLAETKAHELRKFLMEYQEEMSLKRILINLAIATVVLAALFGLFALISFLTEISRKWIKKNLLAWLPTLKFRDLEILTTRQALLILTSLIGFIGFVLKFIATYIALTIIFQRFIWTRTWAEGLLNLVLSPAVDLLKKFFDYIPNLIAIAVIVFVFRLLIRFSDSVFERIAEGKLTFDNFYVEWADPTRKIVKFVLILFAVILIYPYTPIAASTAAQGISIFVGVLFSLGSTSAIGNVIASIVLNYTRSFRIGDTVRIGDIMGEVVEKTALVMRIRTRYNEEVSIPNATVVGSNVINFSEAARRGEMLILHSTVTIGYDVPWQTVHQLLIDAALATEDIEKEPRPFVFQLSLNDNYPVYEINAYTKKPSLWLDTYTKLHANIQDKFNEAGVEILSPSYHVNRLTQETTIPPHYREKSYIPPPIDLSIKKTS
jgi:small-conductance mechanosensitive channel